MDLNAGQYANVTTLLPHNYTLYTMHARPVYREEYTSCYEGVYAMLSTFPAVNIKSTGALCIRIIFALLTSFA